MYSKIDQKQKPKLEKGLDKYKRNSSLSKREITSGTNYTRIILFVLFIISLIHLIVTDQPIIRQQNQQHQNVDNNHINTNTHASGEMI